MPAISDYGIQRLITNLSPEEQIAWENEGDYGYIPPEQRDAANSDDNGDPTPSTPAQATERFREIMRRKAAYEASRPASSDYKPNTWQRLAAAGANFAAGYVNAGGRTRVDPGAMKSINNSLLRPGYQKAVESWEDQGRGLDAEMQGAAADVKMEAAQRDDDIATRRATAYESAQQKAGSLSDARREQLKKPPSKFISSALGVFDTENQKYVDPPPKSPGKVQETPAEAKQRRAEEVKGASSLTPEQKDSYVLTGKIPAPAKPKATGKGAASKARVGTPGQFRGVEKEKQVALSKAEAAYRKVASDPNESPERKAELLAYLEAEKQRIMESYDAGVETFGGSVAPRGGGKSTQSPKQPPAGAKTATNPKTGEKVWFDEKRKQWVPL
jgi:hypothetical protein